MVIKLQLNFIAASLFQRCIGGLQRPIFMQHYGFSAVLVDFSAPLLCSIAAPAPLWWILTHQSGSSATLVDSSASFLCKIWVPPSQKCFPATHFLHFPGSMPHWRIPATKASRLQPRTAGLQRLRLTQHVWTTIVYPRHKQTSAASQPDSLLAKTRSDGCLR